VCEVAGRHGREEILEKGVALSLLHPLDCRDDDGGAELDPDRHRMWISRIGS